MPSTTVNICVLALVLLSFSQICLSRPHSRSKRGMVKDYFVPDPLVFPPEKFEKGGDGKYYLKKSAYKSDSEVKYAAENGDNTLPEDLKDDDVEIIKNEQKDQDGSVKIAPLKEEMTETLVIEEALPNPTPPIIEEVKVIEEVDLSKIKAVAEETAKVGSDSEKAPFKPVDPKSAIQPKPDSKDEIPLKTDLPPIDVDEKVDEKISIGQVPQLYPRVIPVNGDFRLPILIPMRKVSYGAVSVIPIPPVDGSDRLPLSFEDEIMGEGPHESEAIEETSQPIAGEKKDVDYNPLMGIHLPFLSFRTFLKDLKDADKVDSEKQSKVVDVLGKKFLMQSSVMKHPTGDNSHMYVRFMSVKPLEEVKPEILKEEAEAVEKGVEEAKREDAKELEVRKETEVKDAEILKEKKEIEVKDAEILKEKKETEVKDAEILKEKEEIEMKDAEILKEKKESELEKEAEILKAEETQIKMEVNKEVPKEVVLENMGNAGVEVGVKDIEEKEKSVVVSEVKEKKMFEIGDSVIESDETSSVLKRNENTASQEEKMETEVLKEKMDFVPKMETEERKTELGKKTVEESKAASSNVDEMKIESAVAIKEEGSEKAMEVDHKKSFFLLEKSKKQKSMEESEEHKTPKKKIEKKKKKCKCEEKDSDSDEEED